MTATTHVPTLTSTRRGRQAHILLVVENVSLARDHRLRKQSDTLVKAGYRVTVICRRDPGNQANAGIRVRDYRPPADGRSKLGFAREYGYSLVRASWLIARTFATDRFDAVQISGTPDLYFAIAAPFRRLGARLVFDQRDLSPELYELRYGRRGAAYRALLWLERASYRSADHVITVNRSLEHVAYERGGLALGQVSIVGNGPVLARTRSAVARPELRHGRRYLCCWIGVMGPQDRVELALAAVHELVTRLRRTDCHFAFVGDGETRVQCEQVAASLGLEAYVCFPGWLAEANAFDYLATADVAIEPNLEQIVSPVKAMEYLAFGLPFVAFDLTETRALAGDAAAYAEPGNVHEMADRLDALLDDPDRRSRMSLAGRELAEEHVAWECQEQTYLRIYRTLIDPDTATAPPTRGTR
ncbi:MAG: glycosyltransferase family 4 protein [Jatrophihabitantaceae bacterium]